MSGRRLLCSGDIICAISFMIRRVDSIRSTTREADHFENLADHLLYSAQRCFALPHLGAPRHGHPHFICRFGVLLALFAVKRSGNRQRRIEKSLADDQEREYREEVVSAALIQGAAHLRTHSNAATPAGSCRRSTSGWPSPVGLGMADDEGRSRSTPTRISGSDSPFF